MSEASGASEARADLSAEAQRAKAETRPAEWKWALALVAAAAAIVFVAGATSHVVLGDEAYHFMFARAWADAGLAHRPTHNPLYPSGAAPGYYYVSEPLWPMVLATLWQATGPIPWVAQAYQAAIYAVFLALVWRLGKHFLGPRGALAAVLVAVSVPMAGAFSMMLYVDVAASAIILAAIVLLVERRIFWAGVLVGLALLAKRNAAFLAPPMVLWLFLEDVPWRRRIKNLALLVVPAVIIVLPDLFWRRHWIPSTSDPANPVHILWRLSLWFSPQRLSSNINNPLHLAKYLGAVIPTLLALYLVRRTWRKADLPADLSDEARRAKSEASAKADRPLWALLGFYLVTLLLVFTLDTDVRYVMPTVPILAILAARGLTGWWEKRWVLALVALAAFGQLGATAWFVNRARHLTEGQQAVFAYLRTETPEGTRVMYPGESIMIEARRPVVWNQLADPKTGTSCLPAFLTEYGPEEILAALRANGVRYLCIEKGWILSGALAQTERGGYPEAFVERLPHLEFLERVEGDWPAVTLWKVKGEFPLPGASP
ncbi:MAG: glycosyltransferase family 39 protein [Phycisphaerae bacterium]|nr:glycosyltransferase family 39 protein [Phycisphaerae bacterium]